MSHTNGTYRRLLRYLRPYKKQIWIAVVGMVLFAAADGSFAYLMQPLLDGTFVAKDAAASVWVPLAILGVFLMRGVGGFISGYLMGAIGWKIISQMRRQLFEIYLSMPMGKLRKTQSGALVAKVTYDAQQVASAVTDSFTILVRDSLSAAGLIFVMLWWSWELTLILFTAVPLIGVLAVWVTRRFRRINKKQQQAMGDVNHQLNQTIGAMPMIRVFNAQRYVRDRFFEAEGRSLNLQIKEIMTKSASGPIVQFLVAITLAMIVYFASANTGLVEVTVGEFMSFLTAMLMLFQPLRGLTNVNASIQKGLVAAQGIFDLLDQPQEQDTGKDNIHSVSTLRLQNVSVDYAGKLALDGVNLDLQRGKQIALVGASGSGKSSLVGLVTRLLAPNVGQIFADDVDIQTLSLANWRQHLSYVGQDVLLVSDTVASNVAFGAEEVDLARAESALKAAGAWDFVSQLPGGMNYILDDKAQNLSGGERQRIAIARAIYRDADILILDEATSALDATSERVVIDSLKTLSAHKITLIIAHRLSSIEHCDNIVVLNQGKIVEQGDHLSLSQSSGHYAKMVADASAR
ncbi:MAG: lipid A export permease/ATP-binding protein MsbA [Gammaproteobacteria bacterium]|nr:lipid A export permease/ATP-binding protein MsbA [Gammaproteobacteria bacterium]